MQAGTLQPTLDSAYIAFHGLVCFPSPPSSSSGRVVRTHTCCVPCLNFVVRAIAKRTPCPASTGAERGTLPAVAGSCGNCIALASRARGRAQ